MTTAAEIRLAFSAEDAQYAHDIWECNCGPAALAAVLGLTLEEVRPFVAAAGFCGEKRYMSPSMMQTAIRHAGAQITKRNPCGPAQTAEAFAQMPRCGLVRVQWTGPWTNPGANPKWAYMATHWIGCWKLIEGQADVNLALCEERNPVIFDVNGGLMRLEEWEANIIPLLAGSIPRADGNWFITHSWEVTR